MPRAWWAPARPGEVTLLQNETHHVEDGVYLTGSTNILIQDNYIHDVQLNWSGRHYDGIATDSCDSNIIICHNTTVNGMAKHLTERAIK